MGFGIYGVLRIAIKVALGLRAQDSGRVAHHSKGGCVSEFSKSNQILHGHFDRAFFSSKQSCLYGCVWVSLVSAQAKLKTARSS